MSEDDLDYAGSGIDSPQLSRQILTLYTAVLVPVVSVAVVAIAAIAFRTTCRRAPE